MILDLPEARILRTFEDGGAVVIEVISTLLPDRTCPFCGAHRRLNGFRSARFRDVPLDGRPTFIDWRRQQYVCLSCYKPSHDNHPEFDNRRYLTRRMIEWIATEGRRCTFTSLAKLAGMHERNLREVFRAATEPSDTLAASYSTLALELIPLAGRRRPCLIDVGNRALIDVYRSWAACVLDMSFGVAVGQLIKTNVLIHDVGLEDVDSTLANQVRSLFSPIVSVSSPSSVRRSAVELMHNLCDTRLVSCAQREGLSTKFARILFTRRRDDLGRPALKRLERWRRDDETLYRAYELKELFWDIWTKGRVTEWENWKARSRSLLPEIDFDAICAFVDTHLDYLIRGDDGDLARIASFPAWLDRTILSLQPSAGTHSFKASRSVLLARLGVKLSG